MFLNLLFTICHFPSVRKNARNRNQVFVENAIARCQRFRDVPMSRNRCVLNDSGREKEIEDVTKKLSGETELKDADMVNQALTELDDSSSCMFIDDMMAKDKQIKEEKGVKQEEGTEHETTHRNAATAATTHAIAQGAAEVMATGKPDGAAEKHEAEINKTFEAMKLDSKKVVRNFGNVITTCKEMFQETMPGRETLKYVEERPLPPSCCDPLKNRFETLCFYYCFESVCNNFVLNVFIAGVCNVFVVDMFMLFLF